MIPFSLRHALLLLGLLAICTSLKAAPTGGGIQLPQTRVIFSAKQKNATASIRNEGSMLYLVKASVLRSPDDDKSIAPFAMVPPLFRLEPHNSQTVKIIRQSSQALPADRESIFYLSFLAVPALRDGDDTQMRIAIGVQTIIKLFYRPENLSISPEQAADRLQFTRQAGQLVVRNPTPYYQTLSSLSVEGARVDLSKVGQMIAPFSQSTYAFSGHGSTVNWQVINDYGGASSSFQAVISGGDV